MTSILKLILVISCVEVIQSTIQRPRGVPKSLASHYQVDGSNKFRCLDGSKEMPYDYVNDDYCDCDDGSDEPGTSACPRGKFHCTNAGYLPQFIPSSRVNDGVCDCCDGTDEYSGNINCVNNCKELGKEYQEEQQRKKQLQEEGYQKFKQFTEEGKQKKKDKQAKLEELKVERGTLEANQKDLEAKKNEAEIPEKEAKDRHEKAWTEEKERKQTAKEEERVVKAFEELDINKDGFVTVDEMITHKEFDIDANGEVSPEEAKEYLDDNEQLDLDNFKEKIWANIKEIYKTLAATTTDPDINEGDQEQGETASPPAEPVESYHEDEDLDEELDDEDDEDDLDDIDIDHEYRHKSFKMPKLKPTQNLNTEGGFKIPISVVPDKLPNTVPKPPAQGVEEAHKPLESSSETVTVEPVSPPPLVGSNQDYSSDSDERLEKILSSDTFKHLSGEQKEDSNDEEEKMPEYDPETKQLIAAADEARQLFNDADNKLRDCDKEISSIESYLNQDFGPEEEFAVLKDQCFEYTDREYTYKLCPFDRASQRPKNGGSETSLGNWGKWTGPDSDKYSTQLYERGQHCWNGPDRSVTIHLKCGPDHQLTNAYEPSRCEYAFDFSTPTVCNKLPPPPTHEHDEL